MSAEDALRAAARDAKAQLDHAAAQQIERDRAAAADRSYALERSPYLVRLADSFLAMMSARGNPGSSKDGLMGRRSWPVVGCWSGNRGMVASQPVLLATRRQVGIPDYNEFHNIVYSWRGLDDGVRFILSLEASGYDSETIGPGHARWKEVVEARIASWEKVLGRLLATNGVA